MERLTVLSLLAFFATAAAFDMCSDVEHHCTTGKCCEHVEKNIKNFYCCHNLKCDSVEKCEFIGREGLLGKPPVPTERFFCPDHRTICKGNETCCKLISGRYSCCPYPNAVCCENRRYCCPQYFDCQFDECIRPNFLSKEQAAPLMISFPGSAEATLNGEECVYKNGKLCLDQSVCCPENYMCSADSTKCFSTTEDKSSIFYMVKPRKLSTAHEKIQPIISQVVQSNSVVHNSPKAVICPGGQMQCPDGSTCCLLSGGQYGCCPYPNATCCSDHEHCCPSGMKCDLERSRCIGSRIEVPLKTKTKATKIEDFAATDNVVCPGGTKECPSGFTCCKLPKGDYGCCPHPHAVCCSDGVHCCPSGYSCHSGSCVKLHEEIWKAIQKK